MEIVTRLAAEKPVVIFSKSGCCTTYSLQQLISSYGAKAEVYELDRIPNGTQIEKALTKSFGYRPPNGPVVFIGQKFVGGANEIWSLQLSHKLATMLIDAGAIFQWRG